MSMSETGMPLGDVSGSTNVEGHMKPTAAAVAGALIAGTAMYTVGARTASVDALALNSGPSVELRAPAASLAPTATAQSVPFSARPARAQAPQPGVSAPARVRDTRREEVRDDDQRSWTKSALIIGGSAASGAGIGGAVKGKKGALIGAAIGGGAASIYEATQRR
jgi:hypothetical protein